MRQITEENQILILYSQLFIEIWDSEKWSNQAACIQLTLEQHTCFNYMGPLTHQFVSIKIWNKFFVGRLFQIRGFCIHRFNQPQTKISSHGWKNSWVRNLQIWKAVPFYTRDLSTHGFWYTQWLLEPIPMGISRDYCNLLDKVEIKFWRTDKTKKFRPEY